MRRDQQYVSRGPGITEERSKKALTLTVGRILAEVSFSETDIEQMDLRAKASLDSYWKKNIQKVKHETETELSVSSFLRIYGAR